MNKDKILEHLKSDIFGRELILLDEIGSTNDYAKELAKGGASHGTAVIASFQTKGKGRLGRSFFSPKGTGIYMSLILRPSFSADKNMLITSFAAAAVASAIEKVSSALPKIKWVNDIYLNNKKVCGILTESLLNSDTGELQYIILGIGVNDKKIDFPPELSEIATSIGNETGEDISREVLSSHILTELDRLYKTFDEGSFLEDCRRKSNILGREIKVIRGDESYSAKALDIDNLGGLIIEKDGKREILYSGEVSIRLA